MDLKPLDDRVVIRPNDAKEKTDGGIYLPDRAKDKPTIGKVVAAGPGRLGDNGDRIPLSVKVGDEVYFDRWNGSEVEVDGQELRIMPESSLLAVVA